MKKELRKEQILKRRNFLPSLIVTILLFATCGIFVYFVNPDSFGVIPLFFVLVFLSFLFVSSILFGNSRRGLVTASGITIFLILRYLGVGNILNLILIASLALTIELYFSRKA